MQEIQALSQRVQEFSDRVDFWNLVMLYALALTAFAAVFTVISTRLVIVRSGQLSIAQLELSAAKERNLQSDLKGKDVEIGRLTVQSDLAAAGIAAANSSAADAEQKATEAKIAQDQVELDLAKQKERAALAEKELLELQERVRPRRLSEEDKAKMASILKEYPSIPFTAFVTFEAQDGQAYLDDFREVFKRSGWSLPLDSIGYAKFSTPIVGILIVAHDEKSVPAQANGLIKALNEINLRPLVGFDVSIPDGSFAIRIGTKQ